MNEITRLQHEYAAAKAAARADAVANHRLTFHLPDRCIELQKQITHLQHVQGTRHGTSIAAHSRRNT